jgi:hypothetical protein
MYVYGHLLRKPERNRLRLPCRAKGCDKLQFSRGYCRKHYEQLRKHGRLTPELERRQHDPCCGAEGCEETQVARGYCKRHYGQFHKYGRLTPELERGPRAKKAAA